MNQPNTEISKRFPSLPFSNIGQPPVSRTAENQPVLMTCPACSGEKAVRAPFCKTCFMSLLPGTRNTLRQPAGEWGQAFEEAKRYLAGKRKRTFMSNQQKIQAQGIPQISGALIMSDGRCLTSPTPFLHLMNDYKLMATVDVQGFVDCLIAVYPNGSLKIIFRDGLPVEPVEITFTAGQSQP